MPLTAQDFEIYAGESLAMKLVASTDSNGNPVTDLSSWTVDILTRDATNANSTPAVVKSTSSLSVSVNGNVATWVWSSAETETLTRRTAYWVRATDPGGIATMLGYGHIILLKQ